ncbi:MAG: TerB family tellurite resistance protein [Nitrospiraceae bacterium]|nr:MAG: TerB family tellurite resistance protein [Nitrospiraceae bacterium]
MLTAITQFFNKHIKPDQERPEDTAEHSLEIATAALLIQMMRADFQVNDEELQAIADAMSSRFDLSNKETGEILKLAEDEICKSTGYFEFTSLLNKRLTREQKIKVTEQLWEIAFSDTVLDKHEEHMVRKISHLLHLSHREFIDAKLRVKQKLSL